MRQDGSIETLAASLVDRLGSPLPTDLVDALPEAVGSQWNRLSASFERAMPPHVRKDLLSLEERVALFRTLRAVLPKQLHRAIWQLGEAKDLAHFAAQQASFALGLEIGRRLGAAR